MAKPGRRDLYKSDVEPYLSDIYKKLYEGYTEDRVRLALSVPKNTWNEYKRTRPDLRATIDEALEMRKSEARMRFFGAMTQGEEWAVKKFVGSMEEFTEWSSREKVLNERERLSIEDRRITIEENKAQELQDIKDKELESMNNELSQFLSSINNPIPSKEIK